MLPRLLLLSALLAILYGCDAPYKRERPVAGAHLSVEPKDLSGLSEPDFLMRKATIGSRAERMEAIDVIARTNDPSLYTFLIERLKVEDDRFIQIRIMHALASAGDVRGIPVLRRIARWDETRVGIEAMAALYELGDDTLFPRLIDLLKPNEEQPDVPNLAYRALRKMTNADLPPTRRAWLVYYETHRLAPYEANPYWPFAEGPLPKTVAGGTQIEPAARVKPALPDHDVRVRKTRVDFSEFWRNEAP